MIKFGTPVKVHATSHRLKRWAGDTVQTSTRDAIRYGEVMDKRWPGEPVPESTQDLEHKRAVAVRRIPRIEPVAGMVVGQTHREEGYVDVGSNFYEVDSALMGVRRIPLYEVALSVEPGPNGRLPKARLALVHEKDLEEL